MDLIRALKHRSHPPLARFGASAGGAVLRAFVLAFIGCLAAQTVHAADNTVYANDYQSPFAVYTVDPATGAISAPVGNLTFSSIALARRASDGFVFYTEFGVTNGRVATWNPTNGANATIGNLGGGVRNFPRLAFNATGTLYGMDDQSRLYTVNTTNGAATLVGTGPVTGFPASIRGDMAFAPNGTLYATTGDSSSLYTVTTTGAPAATLVGSTGQTLIAGNAFVNGGLLLAVESSASNTIATLSLVNGAASVISTQAVDLYDLAAMTKFANLTISKTTSSTFIVGSNAVYNISVVNNGPHTASGPITVSDTLPAGLTYVSATGTGWTCANASGVVTCTRAGTVTNGTTLPAITLTVTVGAAAAPSVTNTATVSSTTFDHVLPNSSSVTSAVTLPTDLTVAKSHTGNFTQGQSGTYTITVTNSGGVASSGTVTVSDTLPAGLTPGTATGTGWTCNTAGQVVTCTRSNALNGGTSYPSISVPVNVATNAPSSVTNTASVSGGGDSNNGNNTSSDPTTINGVPDLTVAKSHAGNFTQGQSGTYTLNVTNAGGAATSGTVTVSDTLPSGLTPSTATGTGWTCNIAGQVVTCTSSNVLAAAGSYPSISITASVATNAPSSVTNTASVSGGGQTNTANDTASDPTTINGAPNLTIAKSHAGNFTRGQSGTYTVTVTNMGGAATSGVVTVSDTLPAGLTPSSATGTGWTCNIAGQTVTCTRSNALAPGGSYPSISITASVLQSAASSVTNTASVSGGGQTFTGDDSASDPTTIVSSADLSLTKTVNNPNPIQGQNVTFTITLTSAGPSDATNVVVTDALPAGLTFVSATPSAGTYTSATGLWSLASIASGSSVTLQIVARADNAGVSTNTAQITASDQPDPDSTPNNNNSAEDDQASVSIGAAAPPNLELDKSVTPGGTQPPGTELTYTVNFTNTGGWPVSNFVLTDPDPATTLKLNDYTDFKVGSVSNSLGTTGLGVAVAYSNDGGLTYTYTPVGGGGGAPAGYDRAVTHLRWSFTGNLSHVSPNNNGSVSFTVRIR